jgi:SAM-dependent methyltransferase
MPKRHSSCESGRFDHNMSNSRDIAATAARADEGPAGVFDRLRRRVQVADAEFDAIYAEWVRKLSEFHWTPVEVCIRAAELLVVDEQSSILDVGSGAGKFCLIGAACTGARFVGVEQRPRLVEVSREASRRAGLPNAEFIHGNMMSLDWGRFDGFYFYNPFYEHVAGFSPRIDEPIVVSPHLFTNYVVATCVKLVAAKPGARVVSYQGFGGPMPCGFRRILREPAGSEYLELWEKTTEPMRALAR